MEHEDYMREALSLARKAAQEGEVPVGCVIVKDGEIIGRGRNRREELQRTSSHAEMEAIAQANERLRSWRLDGCTLYVTLEPCPMCAGAIVQARPGRIVFGATDERMGAVGGALSLFELPGVNHRPWVRRGVMAQEAKTLLADFFAARRGAKENEREGEGEAR
jgi:tRNA(adenine34) deaminase